MPDASDPISVQYETCMHAGFASHKAVQYADAETHFAAAIQLAENFGPHDLRLARALFRLGHLYSFRRSSAAAEPFVKRALSILEMHLDPTAPEVLECTDELAGIHFLQSHYAAAEPLQKRYLAAREQTLGPAHAEVTALTINLATSLQKQGKLAEAEQLLTRRLDAGNTPTEHSAGSTLELLERLADLAEQQEKYAQAEALYKRLLANAETGGGPFTYQAGIYPLRLARLSARQGRNAEAETFYRHAAAIYERFRAYRDHASILENLAQLLRQTGRHPEAQDCENRARTLHEWHDMTH